MLDISEICVAVFLLLSESPEAPFDNICALCMFSFGEENSCVNGEQNLNLF